MAHALKTDAPLSPPQVIGHGATVAPLDGGRLHLQQGPINLVIRAYGPDDQVALAYQAATQRFQGILETLIGELAVLRAPIGRDTPPVTGPVSVRMVEAAHPFVLEFITPMAAVAGSVADEVMDAIWSVPGLEKAFVNNGGDISLRVAEGQSLDIGIVPSLARAMSEASFTLTADDHIQGVATSGWDGNSNSLGIADAVTVLAKNAAAADAAATMIANRVTADDPAIDHLPASEIDPDSDLGGQPVTVAVGPIAKDTIESALKSGADYAEKLRSDGLIDCALIALKHQWRAIGDVPNV